MPICKICNVNPGTMKVRDKTTKEEFWICEFEDDPENVELVEDNKEMPKDNPDYDEGWGRLHVVKKSKKIAKCRICKEDIPVGSICYNQAQHIHGIHLQNKVCNACADTLK